MSVLKGTTARRLWVGLGVLLVLLAALGVYAVDAIDDTRASLEETRETGKSAGVAVAGMKAGVEESGSFTLRYVRTQDPEARDRAENGRSDFEESRTRYDGLPAETAGDERKQRIGALYDEYAALGETLMDEGDERRAAREAAGEGFENVRVILREQAQDNAASTVAGGPEKGQAVATMNGGVAGVERSLRDYLRDHEAEALERGAGSAGDFREALARFEGLQLSQEERDRAGELERLFDGAMREVDETLAVDASIREDEQRFAGLRADLEAVLDEEARTALRLESGRGSADQALGRTQRLVLVVLAAVLAVLAGALFFGSGAAAGVGRGLRRLAAWAARGPRRVGSRRGLLPVGVLFVALLWVTQSAVQAYAFGQGSFAEALLPPWGEELMTRGLVAAAVILFLAGLHFTLNRPEREVEQEERPRQDPSEDDEARFQLAAIVESSDDAIIARRMDGIVTSWNSGAQRLYGYSAEEVVGGYGFHLVPPERLNEMLGVLEKLRQRESLETYETVHVDKDGRLIDVALTISAIRDSEGNPIGYSTIARDITERKRSEGSLRRQKDLYEALLRAQSEVGEGLVILEDGRVVYTNEAFSEISGYTPGELMALPTLLDLVVPGEREVFGERLRRRLEGSSGRGSEDRQETVILHKSGRRVSVETGVKAIQEAGAPPRLIAIVRDITERKQAEERLEHMARSDHLTGLGNRVLFQDHLQGALARAQRTGDPVALMFVDLDRFKAVNDTLGHAFGDMLLKAVAGELRGCVRETDTIARMGGDEFGVILEGLTEGQDAGVVAQKILKALSRPFDLDGHEVSVSCSIGIAVSPPGSHDALVRDADAAMYRAKQQGRGNYQFHTPEMNDQAFERMVLETGLKRALKSESFVLHYQPQVDLSTGAICGAEVLLRWRDPNSGLVYPDEFIHVLEESGLIVPVGEWVLRTACAQGRAWEDEGLPPLRIAVNLSTRQFKGEDLVGSLARTLDETGLDPGRLELELTESLLMEDIAVSGAMLDELRVLMGLKLAIDDFGTGYSSLSYLKRLPLDTIKIDRSFVRDIATDPNDAAIVTSIINLAHNLRLRVIAEGVETEEQLAYLRQRGCDEVQGYYFSEPLPAREFSELLKKGGLLSNAPARD